MKIERLPISVQTLYADLIERAWTSDFAELMGSGGSVYSRESEDGRRYLYWQPLTSAGVRPRAQTMRFLDYLLYREVNAVALQGNGIPINVPAPERYALHKLLVSQTRTLDAMGQAKAEKDIQQASALIAVLAELRPDDLADAWRELLAKGPSWRRHAARGLKRLPEEPRTILADLTPEEFRKKAADRK